MSCPGLSVRGKEGESVTPQDRNDFPVLRTYRFSLPEGVVYLELPHPLSVASSDELIQWLSIIEHQVQRSPLTPNEATAK